MSWEGSTPHLHYYDHPEVIEPTVERIANYFDARLNKTGRSEAA
jgi:hypothetical protein